MLKNNRLLRKWQYSILNKSMSYLYSYNGSCIFTDSYKIHIIKAVNYGEYTTTESNNYILF
jgi:hypothetical protein